MSPNTAADVRQLMPVLEDYPEVTAVAVLLNQARRLGSSASLRFFDGTAWKTWSWTEVLQRVRTTAAMSSWRGS